MGLNINHVVVPDILHFQTECGDMRGEYPGILRGIMSVSQSTVMDLNNVMYVLYIPLSISYL